MDKKQGCFPEIWTKNKDRELILAAPKKQPGPKGLPAEPTASGGKLLKKFDQNF